MDDLTKEQRKKTMSLIQSKDTQIEIMLRKALWKKGYRYRKNVNTIFGKPDIVLPKYKIAIFCDSEFFHGKDWDQLSARILKGDNSSYWYSKIQRNINRDMEVDRTLRGEGWKVIRFWGSDIKKNLAECVRTVDEAVQEIKMLALEE